MLRRNILPQLLGPKLGWGKMYSRSLGKTDSREEVIRREGVCNKVLVQKYGGTICDLTS